MGKNRKNVILKLIILIILCRNFFYLYFNKKKIFELFQNYSYRNNSFEFFQNYKNKIKTFEFLIFHEFNTKINKQINLEYENFIFAVIKTPCKFCGLFSAYISFLGCIRQFMIKGFIPVLELESYKNVINGFTIDPSKGNPWEYYFNP